MKTLLFLIASVTIFMMALTLYAAQSLKTELQCKLNQAENQSSSLPLDMTPCGRAVSANTATAAPARK